LDSSQWAKVMKYFQHLLNSIIKFFCKIVLQDTTIIIMSSHGAIRYLLLFNKLFINKIFLLNISLSTDIRIGWICIQLVDSIHWFLRMVR
jgi:predicted AlkP superfamily phosphohydrolase/phosphomutase